MPHDKLYTAATRGREEIDLFTSDKIALQEALGMSGERQSAIELAQRAAALHGPSQAITEDGSYQIYQSQQPELQAKKAPKTIHTQEITHSVQQYEHHISL
jgi:hypothetical protein